MEGPLASFEPGMVEHLDSQGYSPETVIRKVRLVGKLSRFLQEAGRAVGDLGTTILDEFASEVELAPSDRITATTFAWLIEFLVESGELAPVSSPPDSSDLLVRFRHYLAIERGLLPKTVVTYARVAQRFLVEHPEHDLRDLSPAAVTRYVTRECRRLDSPRAAERLVTGLRSLLTFALLDGVISSPLSAVIPSVARWGGASLPRGLAPEQLAAMLASCDRDRTKGKRDYAILVLLSRLGLRAAEVAALRLDDIDWRGGEIVVRGKGRSEERLPLPYDVGAAVADYLRHGRSDRPQQREVFLRLVAPCRGLAPQGVSEVVRAASERAGVGSFGAHRLRHTAGSEMLRAGASLPEVAQVLRHRGIATTAIYAKVDHLALRELAMPWPGAVR
jgi:integrase/recombinase XerD